MVFDSHPKLISVGLAMILLSSCDGGETPDHEAPETGKPLAEATLGPVTARVHATPAAPRFGERVTFHLEITAQPTAVLEPPQIPARLGHFRVRGHAYDGSAASGRLSYVITTEPEKTGQNICRLPKIAFRIESGEGAGTEQELLLRAFEVEVAGLPPDQQPDLNELGTPLPPVRLPAGGGGRSTLWIVIGASVLLLVCGLFWWRRRRRAGGAEDVTVDPGEEAAAAFLRLLAEDLAGQGRFAEFYVGLTGIVRRYIERTTGIHAPEETTEEFLREMEGHQSFEPAQRRRLRAFLEASDLVKFAAQVPSAAELDEAVGSARSFCGLGQPEEVAA